MAAMDMPQVSAMDRFMRAPELSRLVFDQLDKIENEGDLLSCALTCKKWSEAALDKLWINPSLHVLLSLLAPLRKKKPGFPRPIRPSDWSTFERYARRVRDLVLDDLFYFSPKIFVEIARKRPTITLLPRLSRLEVHLDLDDNLSEYALSSLLFTSDSVRDFTLVLPYWDRDGTEFTDCASEFLEEFSSRMPNLHKLALCSAYTLCPISIIEEDVAEWILAMPGLITFSCSYGFANSRVMSALSQLPLLQKIELEHYEGGSGCGSDFETFRPSITSGAFAALMTLEFCAKFDHAADFLRMDCAPALITVLLHSPQLENAEALQGFLSALSKARPLLTRLRLCSVQVAHHPLTDEGGREMDRVTLKTLEPLRALRKLVDLRISYHRQFQLTEADLEKLLDGWHEMDTLGLCSDPFLREEVILSSRVLYTVASRCPKLRHLYLYLNTGIDVHHDLYEPVAFQFLESIKFGTSRIADKDVDIFSLFLSRILPVGCRADPFCDADWLAAMWPTYGGAQDAGLVDLYRWEKVSKNVKMLMVARAEEQLISGQLLVEYNNLTRAYSELEARCNKLETALSGLSRSTL